MPHPIVYVDTSQVVEGKLPELRAALAELADFVEDNAPRALAYNAYLDADARRLTVVHVHPDATSLQRHMETAGPRFRRFRDLVRLDRIDVYGDPGTNLLAMLREKAQLLGGDVAVHHHEVGFFRFEAAMQAGEHRA